MIFYISRTAPPSYLWAVKTILLVEDEDMLRGLIKELLELKGFSVKVEKSGHPKCERCWNLRPDVGSVAAHPAICARCAQVVG